MTPHDIRKYIFDVREAIEHIENFTRGKSFADYCSDPMLRSAVERQFEIIGEAFCQVRNISPDCLESIRDSNRIIAFRNRLIHGYSTLSNKVVWGIVQEKLPALKQDLDKLDKCK